MKRILPAALAVVVLGLAAQVLGSEPSRAPHAFRSQTPAECPFLRAHAAAVAGSSCPFARPQAVVGGATCPFLRGRVRPVTPPAWRLPEQRVLTASAPAAPAAVGMLAMR